MFKIGRGSKALELLGPSIAYFWNDIYDVFDIEREMSIQKLDNTAFSTVEIKRLFDDLAEDMEEDYAEIWLEIQNKGKRLHFLEINILPGIDLDEQQEILNEFIDPDEKAIILSSAENYRILHYTTAKLIVMLVYQSINEENEDCEEKRVVDTNIVRILAEKSKEITADRSMLVTWHEISADAKSLARESNIELIDSEKMLREINRKNLEMALDNFRIDATGTIDRFTKEKFSVYLDLVKSAPTNLAKKESLENLAKYILSSIKGLTILKKDYRGPSEEFDLIVANESIDAPLKAIGNPIAVECRHRRTPASSGDIRDFCGKLTTAGLKAGILISLKGVTGNRYDAIGEVREARKKGISIIVITIEDLNHIKEGKKPFEIIRDSFYKFI